ncbi:MAG: LLM class flavin-dependent oxidoreductase [Actinomycetota bacterium]|nr:LLM class flavin-dependent oxidoreductase [Actinomycetota bacterium]
MGTNQEQVTFGLAYDFRNPEPWRKPTEALYQEVLDQIVWAEGLGFRSVWLTEHHFCDDGYTPSPLTIAAAIGARTQHMHIGTNLLVLPLHDPIRIAEDAATVSILTGGRFRLGVGQGYHESEFEGFGRKIRNRPSLLEEGVEVIRRAWSGDMVNFSGKRVRVEDVRITPVPESPLPLLVGALADPAIERAARIGDGYLDTLNAGGAKYVEALSKVGKDPAEGRIYSLQWPIIDEDPERTWAEVGQHSVYQWNEYIGWGVFGPPDQVPRYESPKQLVEAGMIQLWDASTAVAQLSGILSDRPQTKDLHFFAQLPGEPVESGSRRVEYLATKVMPEVLRTASQTEREEGTT